MIARPHYHAVIFNHDFGDKELWTEKEGIHLYTSDTLTNLWGKGFATTGDVTLESAAYVARYVVKKQTGDNIDHAYPVVCEYTGEIICFKKTEYATMSRRPGIGNAFFKKFTSDFFPSDFITVKGKKMPVPAYYNGLYEHTNPLRYEAIRRSRIRQGKQHPEDQTPERLATREYCKIQQTNQLARNKI